MRAGSVTSQEEASGFGFWPETSKIDDGVVVSGVYDGLMMDVRVFVCVCEINVDKLRLFNPLSRCFCSRCVFIQGKTCVCIRKTHL